MRLGRLAAIAGLIGCLVLLAVPPARAAVNDPGLPKQWAIPAIGAPDAWATGTGAGVTIAVVDTGVDFGHEELAGKLLPGKNFVDPAKSPQDDHGHGTHVAGIAAAATNNGRGIAGVAPDAKLLPVKVLDAKGEVHATLTQDSTVEAGIKYAADQGAAVVNLSLGDAGISAVLGPSFAAAVRYAWNKGAICVVSAGNSGDPNSSFITSSNFSNEPAVVVTALNRAGAKPTYASTIGAAKWGMAAPGGAANGNAEDDILSSWWASGRSNTYAFVAGTSMAAPHVAGAAAVLRGLGLTPQQTVDKLLATARDIGDAGNDSTYGHGALDMKAAVAGLRPAGGGSTATTAKTPATTKAAGGAGGGRTPSTSAQGSGPGDGTVSTIGELATVKPSDDKTEAGDLTSGQSGGSDEAATPSPPTEGDTDHRPWPALAVALVTLLGATALLAKATRPKPI